MRPTASLIVVGFHLFLQGLKKQTAWVDSLKQFVEESGSIDPDVKAVIDVIVGYDNVPQKKPKFLNFAKNVCGRRFAPATMEKAWETIEAACKKRPASTEAPSEPEGTSLTTEGSAMEVVDEAPANVKVKQKKLSKNDRGKKRSAVDDEEEDGEKENGSNGPEVNGGLAMFAGTAAFRKAEPASKQAQVDKKVEKNQRKEEHLQKDYGKKARKVKAAGAAAAAGKKAQRATTTKGRFDFEKVVMELLKKKNKGKNNEPVKLNRIKKKVVAVYLSDTGLPLKSELEVSAKLEKHLSKNKKFVLMKDSVSLAKNN